MHHVWAAKETVPNVVTKRQDEATTSCRYDFIDVTRALAAFLMVVSHMQQMIIDRPLTCGAIHKALSILTTQGYNAVSDPGRLP